MAKAPRTKSEPVNKNGGGRVAGPGRSLPTHNHTRGGDYIYKGTGWRGGPPKQDDAMKITKMLEQAASKCKVLAFAIKELLESHQRGTQVPKTPPVPPADEGAPIAIPPADADAENPQAGAPTIVVVDPTVVPGRIGLDILYEQMDDAGVLGGDAGGDGEGWADQWADPSDPGSVQEGHGGQEAGHGCHQTGLYLIGRLMHSKA